MSLSVKNMLGGGKPEGMYAWTKSIASYEYNTLELNVTNTYTVRATDGNPIKFYVADAYTIDEANHVYVLTNPTEYTLEYGNYSMQSVASKKYVTIDSPQSRVLAYNNNIVSMYVYNNSQSSSVQFAANSSSYPVSVYKIIETFNTSFVGYVVDGNSDKYPNKEIYSDGYYYEKVFEIDFDFFSKISVGYELTKFDTGIITPTSNTISINSKIYHNLGEKPKMVLLIDESGIYTGEGVYSTTFVCILRAYSENDANVNSIYAFGTSTYGGHLEGSVRCGYITFSDTYFNDSYIYLHYDNSYSPLYAGSGNSMYFIAEHRYRWIALA